MGGVLNPENSLASSFPRRRESSEANTPRVRGCCRFIGFTTTAYPLRVRGQDLGSAPLCGACSINWIPACAGMTVLMDNLG